jgi:hypothetical protein
MRVRFWILSFAVVWSLVSCASSSKEIPVSGSDADVSQLVGEWSGEYHAASSGRSGLISFKLEAEADSASGDVLMFTRQRAELANPGRPNIGPTLPQGLTIRFVNAANGMVSGRLDPYTDPECSCQVETVFEGQLHDSTITGHYTARRSGTTTMTGDWKVTRKK